MENKKIDNLIKKYEEYARENNFVLNKDKKYLNNIVRAILNKKNKLGDFYCPCRVMTGDSAQDKKIVCPCIFHKEEIEKSGCCKCRLFFKK